MTGAAAGLVDVVVVAAGSSTRMAGIDKLQATLLGRPLLAWTLDALRAATSTRTLVLVTAPDRVEPMRDRAMGQRDRRARRGWRTSTPGLGRGRSGGDGR